MTKTKKILGIVLALIVLTLAMSVSIFAQDTENVVLPDGVTDADFGDNTVTDGTNFYATIKSALEGIHLTNNRILYCKPGADVGVMTHGHVCANLTVYGNGASLTASGEQDFELDTYKFCHDGAKTCDGVTGDLTLTVKNLNGCGAWGQRTTSNTVNIVFENCKDMNRVYVNGTSGINNITLTNCSFLGTVENRCTLYSNANGTVTVSGCEFENIYAPINLNHKIAGTQTIVIENTSFDTCGTAEYDYAAPVRVLSSVEGAESALTVSGCTFANTVANKNGQDADILIDYGVGTTNASVSSTAAKVTVEVENNVSTDTTVSVGESKDFANVEQTGLKGTGTEADPFLIEDLDDLIWFRDQVDLQLADGSTQFAGKYFMLTADIDLAGINWNPIGSMTGDHGSFKGVFDGNGHTISNLYVEQAGTGLGLFARTAGNAVIKNVNLDNVTIKSTDNSNYAGGLVGNAYASTYIENVHITGDVYISGRGYIGGIAGHGYVVMDNVSVVANEGSVITSSFWCCGGILGYGGEGVTDISNAHVEGVTITSAAGGLGAIVGMAEDNNGTQPISGSNLSAKNVEIKTYVGAYGEDYANYALGYLYGGNPTSELTGTLEVEDVKVETSTGEAVQVNDAVASVNGAIYFSFADAFANAVNGDTVALLRDVEISGSIYVSNKEITFDGNNYKITQATDATYGNFLVPLRFNSGSYTIKNVDFDGWTTKSVLRIENGSATLDNVTIQNTNWSTATQAASYGVLYIENADVVVKNSKFLNNVAGSTVTYGYGSSSDMATTLEIDNCLFQDNVSNGDCSIVYYVKGSACTITNTEFIDNKVNCNTNGATIYLGFKKNCTVTGCLFDGNQVVDSSTSTRVAGAIFTGNATTLENNVFTNNSAANANGSEGIAQSVCVSTYYANVDISENYFDGGEPVLGVDYFVQHTDMGYELALESYYTSYTTDENGNIVLEDKVEIKSYVAEVNGVGYETLAEAFANANGGTVVLLDDITIDTETITIADGVSVTLDMNGKTITVVDNKASNVCYELFYIYGELTVTGNGTIKLTSNSNDTAWAKSSSIFHNRGGVLTIENGTFEHLGGTCMAFVVDNSGNWFGDATTNIYGGTLTSTYTAIRNRMEENSHGASGTAILNITGGTINGTTSAIWAQAASTSTTSPATGLINVSGGNIGLINTARSAGAECMTTISGGTVAAFKGEVGELTVTGVTLDNVTILTASGEAADYVINANGTYVLAVAKIGDVNYETLADAFANANGGTVTLLDNIELDAPIEVTGTVVLDLAGYTINYTSTVQGEAMITNKGNLTINDSVGTGVINYDYVGAADSSYGKGNYTISNGGTLTVNGGKITIANLRAHAKYPIDNNSTTGDAILVINGGHLYNYNTSAIRMFCNSTTNKNSVTINGGLIEGYCSIWVQNPGKNTVNGQLSITGGEIKTTAAAYVNGTAELKDVSSRIYFSISGEGGAWSTDSFASITGGTFNENVYLAEEAPANITIDETAPVFNGYVELPTTPVASVNGVEYGTLQEAIDAANTGDTLVLLDNITVTEGYVIDKSIIIDLNGKTVALENSDESVNCLFNIVGDNVSVAISNGTLTVEYGQVIYVGKNDSDVASNPTVSLDSVTLTGANYGLTVAGNGIVNINANTTITGAVEAVRVFDDAKATIVAGATITCTDASKSAVMAYDNATVTISGGNFNGAMVETENATVEITGGSFSVDPSDLVIDGYVAIANLAGIYVVGEKPTATVNDMGPMLIPAGDYMVYGNGNNTADMPLSFVMQFLADQNASDMANSPYSEWYGDFVITFTGIEGGSFTADGCYLAGHYGSFGWVKVPVDGMTIEEGVRYPVMLGVGMGQKYDYICSSVEDFKCALYLTPEVLAENPNIQVTLELAVVDNSQGEDAAASALVSGENIYNVTDYSYDAEDFVEVKAVASVTDSNGKVTNYLSLQEAIAYANENGGTVTLLDNIALSETIAVTGTVTLDLNGYTITGTDNSTGSFGLFTNKGTFTITGNGAITLVATNNRAWNNYSSVISNQVGGKLIVEGGTIEHLGGTDMAYAIDNLTNGKGTYAETIINGGLIKSTYRAIRQFLNGVEAQNILTVNGGTIEGANKAIWFQDPSVEANSGTLTVGENAIINGDIYLTVTAGSTEWPVGVSIVGSAVNGEVLTNNNVPEGYAVQESNGIIGVVEVTYVAEVNGTKYESLQEAIAYANANGGTVTLLGNIELSESIKVTGTVTLDLNGYAITGTDNNVTGNFYLIDNVGTLTVTDSSENKTGKITLKATTDRNWNNSSVVIATNPGGKLTVESGTIEHLGGTDMAYAIDNLTNGKGTYAETVINGGTIKSAYIAVRQFLNGIEAQNILTINGGTIDGANSAIYFQSPNAEANTGTLIVKAEAVLTNRVYLGITDGTTEWPVEISIAAGAFAEDVATKIAHDTIPDGYEIVETNGIIGVEEKAEEKIDVKYYNVDLGTDLAINFAYAGADFDEALANYYAVIKKCHIEDCDHTSQTYYVSGKDFYLDSNGYVQVKASSIAASEMVCDIEITIYKGTYTTAEDGTVTENGVAVSNTYTSSVVKFVESAIDVYASIDKKEELYTLMADMLVYGAEAQKVFKHTNTVLATEFSTIISEFVEQYSTEYDDEGNYVVPDMEMSVTTEESTKYYAGFNVDLEHTIFLNLYFQGVDMSKDFDAKIKFTHHNGDVHEYSVKEGTLNWKNNNGFLQVNIDDLAPADLRLDVECIVLVPNSEGVLTEASKVILSVEDYVAAAKASGKTDGIYDAILRYADSAESYFYPAN